jgi:hypothetical protein
MNPSKDIHIDYKQACELLEILEERDLYDALSQILKRKIKKNDKRMYIIDRIKMMYKEEIRYDKESSKYCKIYKRSNKISIYLHNICKYKHIKEILENEKYEEVRIFFIESSYYKSFTDINLVKKEIQSNRLEIYKIDLIKIAH